MKTSFGLTTIWLISLTKVKTEEEAGEKVHANKVDEQTLDWEDSAFRGVPIDGRDGGETEALSGAKDRQEGKSLELVTGKRNGSADEEKNSDFTSMTEKKDFTGGKETEDECRSRKIREKDFQQ